MKNKFFDVIFSTKNQLTDKKTNKKMLQNKKHSCYKYVEVKSKLERYTNNKFKLSQMLEIMQFVSVTKCVVSAQFCKKTDNEKKGAIRPVT